MPRLILSCFVAIALLDAAISTAVGKTSDPLLSSAIILTTASTSPAFDSPLLPTSGAPSSIHNRRHPRQHDKEFSGGRLRRTKSLQRRAPRPADSKPRGDESAAANDVSGSASGGKIEKNKTSKFAKSPSKKAKETPPKVQGTAPDTPGTSPGDNAAATANSHAQQPPLDAKAKKAAANAAQASKLSGFASLEAARVWLLGRTQAHIDRLGAYRALTDMWLEYDSTSKRLRRLKSKAAALPPNSAAAKQMARDAAAQQLVLKSLLEFVNVRRQFVRYMAKLAGVFAPTARDGELMATVERTVARLRDMGYDLSAKAAEIVPPHEMEAALAEAEAAQAAAAGAKEAGRVTPRQRWEAAVETLVGEALEQEASTGTSWLQQHKDAEAKRRYLLSRDSLWEVLRRIRDENPDHDPTLTRAMEENLQIEINRAFTQCVADGYPEDLTESCRRLWSYVTPQRKVMKPVFAIEFTHRKQYRNRVNKLFIDCLKKRGKESYDDCMRESERELNGVVFRPRVPAESLPFAMALHQPIRNAAGDGQQSVASGLRGYLAGGAPWARLWPPPSHPSRSYWRPAPGRRF